MIRKIVRRDTFGTGTPLYVIVLVNLALKLFMFCYISPWDKSVENSKIVIGDSKGYEQVAERLLVNHTYAPAKDTININTFSEYKATGYTMWFPDCWMMPVYPTFLAAIYSITGIKPWIAILIQIFLSLISVVLVYRICKLLFENSKVATIAALLFAIDIHSIYSANEMLTDTLFVLLLLAGIYYFIKGMKSDKIALICLAALFMGLACLTRLLVLIYPVVLVFILWVFSKQKFQWKLKAILSYALIFGLLTGVWSYRNHKTYGQWELTAHGGWTLLMFNTSLTKSKVTHENLDSIRVGFQKQADSLGYRKSKDIFAQSEIYQGIATDYIRKHKATYVLTNMQGCINMFLALGNRGMANTLGWTKTAPEGTFAEISADRIKQNFSSNIRESVLGLLIILIMAIQYMGAVYGIIKLIKIRNWMLLSLFFLTIGYFCIVTGILGNYRFKLPVVPLICAVAGYGYVKSKSENKKFSTQN
ncbi:MAG TPA: glycosyltransferase family 39 protein [Bacteroidia bacterium]|nr:glycosyltransferase family 39 protein [Bacteroidia bacterium]